MKGKNTFQDGVLAGVSEYHQKDSSLVSSINGTIIGDNKIFIWKTKTGNEVSYSFPSNYRVFGYVDFADNLVVLLIDIGTTTNHPEGEGPDVTTDNNLDQIGILTFDPITFIAQYELIYMGDLSFDIANPIQCLGVAESDTKRRIYWWDGVHQPKSYNVLIEASVTAAASIDPDTFVITGNAIPLSTLTNASTLEIICQNQCIVYIEEEPGSGTIEILPANTIRTFSNMYQLISGRITYTNLSAITNNFLNFDPMMSNDELIFFITYGTLFFGSYFYCYRLISRNDHVFDWSFLRKAPMITECAESKTGYEKYQETQGESVGKQSTKGYMITLNNVDAKNIREVEFGFFYSNDLDQAPPGKIFARVEVPIATQQVPTANISVFHRNNDTLGTILITDINMSSITILKNRVATLTQNHLVLGDLEERREFVDEHYSVTASLAYGYYKLLCDEINLDDVVYASPNHALFGQKDDDNPPILRMGQWYRLIGSLTCAPVISIMEKTQPYADPNWWQDVALRSFFINTPRSMVESDYVGATVYYTLGLFFRNMINGKEYWWPVAGTQTTLEETGIVLTYNPVRGYITTQDNIIIPTPIDPANYRYWFTNIRLRKEILGASTFTQEGTTEEPAVFQSPVRSPYTLSQGGFLEPIIHIPKYSHWDETLQTDNETVYDDISLINPATLTGGFLDYKNPVIASKLVGYAKEDQVAIGLLPYDLFGKKMAVIHLGFINMPKFVVNDKQIMSEMDKVWYLNILHPVINQLNLTEIIDKISGFSIVRGKIQNGTIAEGLLQSVFFTRQGMDASRMDDENNNKWINAADDFKGNSLAYEVGHGVPNDKLWCKNLYTLISPDVIMNEKLELQKGDVIELLGYLKPVLGISNENYAGKYLGKDYYWWFFVYDNNAERANVRKAYEFDFSKGGNHAEVLWGRFVKSGEIISEFQPKGFLTQFGNYTYGANDGLTFARTSARFLMEIDFDEVLDETNAFLPMIKDSPESNNYELHIPYVRIVRNSLLSKNVNPYDEYFDTGYYLKITQEFKDSIKKVTDNGNTYIIDNINVFGGDTFVYPFDIMHTIRDDSHKVESLDSKIIIYPTQSKINLAMRYGEHASKNFLPIFHNSADELYGFEDFLYNKGIQSGNVGNKFLSMDYDTFNMVQQNVLRWSKPKTFNEKYDSFTTFPSENYFGMTGNYGRINGLYFFDSRMYILLEKFVGYIPIRERSVVQGSAGGLVVGETGEFERLEEASRDIGCSHRFGVIPIKDGILWFDRITDSFYQVTGGKFSILQNLTAFYRNQGIFGWHEFDDYLAQAGIAGGFEKDTSLVYITLKEKNWTTSETIHEGEENEEEVYTDHEGLFITICYYPEADFVNGLMSFKPSGYLDHGGKLFTMLNNVLYVHNLLTSGQGKFYGTVYSSKLSFVISDKNHLDKVWDRWILLGNEIPPTRITYKTDDVTITEEVASGMNIINQYVEFQGGRFYGSMPIETGINDGRRLYGDTMLVEIEFNNALDIKAFVKEFLFEYREVL